MHNDDSANQMDDQTFSTPSTTNPDEGFGAGVGWSVTSGYTTTDECLANGHQPHQVAYRPLYDDDSTFGTDHSLVQGGDFVPSLPGHPSPAHWVGGSNHSVLDIQGSESRQVQPLSGSAQDQGLASQFLSGPSAGFNFLEAEDAGFQQTFDGFLNNDESSPFNTSTDFSASSRDWNYGLADTLPGAATDISIHDQFSTAESQTNPALDISAPTPPIQGTGPALQPPPAIAPAAATANARIPCSILGCSVAFNRDGDRMRHEASVHGLNQAFQLYLCPIAGCPKSWDAGYTRKDKLTEHMWKKHGDLGFVKRVL